jgi:hypothetical protein
MWDKPTETSAAARNLRQVLVAYLQRARLVALWPGADGLTIEDILDFYPKAVVAGEVPDWQQLLREHPELEAEIHAWRAGKELR